MNDLSSRLEFLSIEKKKIPKPPPVDAGEVRKRNLPEYASFEPESKLSTSKDTDIESLTDNFEESTSDNLCDDNLCDDVHDSSNIEPREDENLVSARQSFESNFEEVEYGKSGATYEGDNCLNRGHKYDKYSNRIERKKPESKSERLKTIERSFVSSTREEEDDDSDCVVVSGSKVVKKADRCGGKFREADCSVITNVLDEDRDDSCLEDQEFFTLKGPKSNYRLNGKIAKMLFPHQREGLRWLWSLHCQGKGGILGDDMGLGKTMQVIMHMLIVGLI